jgi:hypothetical protein
MATNIDEDAQTSPCPDSQPLISQIRDRKMVLKVTNNYGDEVMKVFEAA